MIVEHPVFGSSAEAWRLDSENANWVQSAPFSRIQAMENVGIGWIAAIVIGGIAGWLAEQFMKSDMGC